MEYIYLRALAGMVNEQEVNGRKGGLDNDLTKMKI